MNRFCHYVVLLVMASSLAHGYPAAYGPFERGEFPAQAAVRECVPVSPAGQGAPHPISLSFAISIDSGAPIVHLKRIGHDMDISWIITVTGKDGKPLGQSTTNDMPSNYVSTYSADMNQDGIPDFMVNIWSGGCGLAAEGIQTDVLGNGHEKTRDGRDHHFWVHQLYRFSGSQMVEANQADSRFPKWVWFSNKDNHKETDLLSTFQKRRLLTESNNADQE